MHKLHCYWASILESPDGLGEDGSAVSSLTRYGLLSLPGVLPNGIQIIIVITIIVSDTCSIADVSSAFKHFTYVNSFSLLNNPVNQLLLTLPLFRSRNWVYRS